MEPVQPDGVLSAIVGHLPLPRSEMIKRLWDYIHRNNLQDQQRKMIINADEKLRRLFGGKAQVSVVELLSIISAHLTPKTAPA